MREKEREATKIFIDYIQEYIIMYKTGVPRQKEEMNDLGNRLKKLGYRVYMEEPSSFLSDFLAKFRLVKVSFKKEKQVLVHFVDKDVRLWRWTMGSFCKNKIVEGNYVYKKKKIRECTNEELLRNHSQLVDIEYEICGGYGEATRINLLNVNEDILNKEIEIKCMEK